MKISHRFTSILIISLLSVTVVATAIINPNFSLASKASQLLANVNSNAPQAITSDSNKNVQPSFAYLLNPDGTLNLSSGLNGSFDAKGYRMTYGANGAPIFMQATGNPDDNWDSRFNLPGVDGDVYAIAVSGNDVYVGGYFSAAGGVKANNIAKWNGTSWSALGSGVTGGNSTFSAGVSAIAVSGNNVYVGGFFTNAGGVSANSIARWNGTSWSAMGNGVTGGNGFRGVPGVYAIAVSGSDVYVGGNFSSAGVNAGNLARWNGTTWSEFGGADNIVRAIAISGTNVYVGGSFNGAGGVSASKIVRWNGTAWSAMGSGIGSASNDNVATIGISGNDVYVGGRFTQAGGADAAGIAKWDGTNWSALGGGVSSYDQFSGTVSSDVRSLIINGNDIYVGGGFNTAGGIVAKGVAKWNGSSWSSLGSGLLNSNDADGFANVIAVNGNDVYVGGGFIRAGGVTAQKIAKFNNSVWSQLGGSGSPGDFVTAMALSGNDLYAITPGRMGKWNGSAWSFFDLKQTLNAIAVSGNDVYVGGNFSTIAGLTTFSIAKWNGTSWSALGNGITDTIFFGSGPTVTSGQVRAIAANNNDVYVGGTFRNAGGVSASNIAKWNGTSWSALGSSIGGDVYAIAINGNDVYVGGRFTTAGGISSNYIAKWNGASWSALGSGLNGEVTAIAVNGNDVYVGGNFTTAGGGNASRIAKWNGTAWSGLGSGITPNTNAATPVSAIVVSGNDLYVGGDFSAAGGIGAKSIAKWNGTNWSSLGSGVDIGGFAGSVSALAATTTGLYAGGSFTFAGNKPSFRFGKYDFTPPAISLVTQPSSQIACLGGSVTFSVLANGTALSYQWKKNGSPITNATTNSLTIPAVTSADTGSYEVVITSGTSSVSSVASLFVGGTTNITQQPVSLARKAGEEARFSVTVTGSGLSYQWRRNGILIGNDFTLNQRTATSAQLILPAVRVADAGTYDLVITGNCGSVISNPVTLTVEPISLTAVPALNLQQGQKITGALATLVGKATVTAGFASGVNISSLSIVDGVVNGSVEISCNAAVGTVTIPLTARTSAGDTVTSDLTINIAARKPLAGSSYSPTTVVAGGRINALPSAPFSGSVGSVTVSAPGYTGGLFVETNGTVRIRNAAPKGNFTVTVTARDNCEANSVQMTFPLTVTAPPAGTDSCGNINFVAANQYDLSEFKQLPGYFTETSRRFLDLNGDKAVDLLGLRLVVSSDPLTLPSNQVVVRLNDGNGNLGTAQTYTVPGIMRRLAYQGTDFDDDGFADFIIRHKVGEEIRFAPFINKGDGTFTNKQSFILNSNSGVGEGGGGFLDNDDSFNGDINGDGLTDFISGSTRQVSTRNTDPLNPATVNALRVLTIHKNNGNGTFDPVTRLFFQGDADGDYYFGQNPPLDVNRDGKQDFLVAYKPFNTFFGEGRIWAYFGSSNFNLTTQGPFTKRGILDWRTSLQSNAYFSDDNGDGFIDIRTNYGGTVVYGHPDGIFRPTPPTVAPPPPQPASPQGTVWIRDINGDGLNDAVGVRTKTVNSIDVKEAFIAVGEADKSYREIYSAQVPNDFSPSLQDFNGDRFLDVWHSRFDNTNNTYSVTLITSSSAETYLLPVTLNLNAGPPSLIEALDLNKDGRTDLLHWDTNDKVTFFMNVCGTPTGNTPPTITAASALTRTAGSAGTTSTIATVSDIETPTSSLIVTATTVPTGIIVSNITNTNGTITANVAAAINATPGNNTVVLTVTDGGGLTATANLTINVTPTGNTGMGSNVTVTSNNTTVTFSNVTTAGNTTITPIAPAEAGALPNSYTLVNGSLAFEITTTAVFSGPITITFNVPSVMDATIFSTLRVLHGEGSPQALVDRTVLTPDTPAPNFATKQISARVTSLSPFVIAAQNAPVTNTLKVATSAKFSLVNSSGPGASLLTGGAAIFPVFNGDVSLIPATAVYIDDARFGGAGPTSSEGLADYTYEITVSFPADPSLSPLVITGTWRRLAASLGGFVVTQDSIVLSPPTTFTLNSTTLGTINVIARKNSNILELGFTQASSTPLGNTPTGSNVSVTSNNTTVTFSNVTTAGNTTITPIATSAAGTLPNGYTLVNGSLAFEITTTAVFSGPITITFNMPGVTDATVFSTLRVLHGEGSPQALVDRTVLAPDTPAPNFATKQISARVTTLSPFVIAALTTTPPTGCAVTQLQSPTNYTTADTPSAIAHGDFNGDGKPDLVTANYEANAISVLLNNGTGGFAPAVNYNAGGNPKAVAVGDLNGDNKLDLVVANLTSFDLSVFLGKGDGTFTTAPRVTGMNYPTSVAIGDFNNDGKADLVVANSGSFLTTVVYGNGDGTFTFGFEYFNFDGGMPYAVTAGDFNKDGKQDFAVAFNTKDAIGVYLNLPSGLTNNIQMFPAGDQPIAIAAGDFDGDGTDDVAAANYGSNNVTVVTSLSTVTTIAVGSLPETLAVADLNGDAKKDLIVGNAGTNFVSLLTATSSGQFTRQDAVGVESPSAVAATDINSDGKVDVIVADYWVNRITTYQGACGTTSALETASNLQTLRYVRSKYDGYLSVRNGNGRRGDTTRPRQR